MAGNHQFFVWDKGYAVGLFTIAQRRIHDFYLNAALFSHSSILSF